MNKFVPFMLIFFFISGSFVTAFNPVLAETVGDHWNTKASMNRARANLGVAVVDGKIYAIGGYTVEDNNFVAVFVGTNECYDPVSNTWVTLEPMPTPRAGFAIATYQGKIYCIGGDNSAEEGMPNGLCSNEFYDPITDSWSSKSDAPFFGPVQAAVVNGKIFVTQVHKLFMYDPVTDVWTKKTSMPQGYAAYLVVVDNKLLAIYSASVSGFGDAPFANFVMLYDPKTDTWREKTRSDTFDYKGTHLGVSFAVGATTDHYAPQKIYFIGGKNTIVYNPVNDSWSTAKAIPTQRYSAGVAVVDDTLYVIGGGKTHTNSLLSILFGWSRFEAFSVTEQYIPLNYSGNASPTSKPFLDDIGVAVIFLTIIGIIAIMGVFFYFKKKKS
ncbi:MAG: hypothetical protein FWC33_04405 [Candidatus Bathyarchaeota archaeon]|nr:hypothetical protein [Candidatus Termiticorpusculum sp.]